MKMEQTECSEMSAYKIQTPGNYPEENIQDAYYPLECCNLRGIHRPVIFTAKLLNFKYKKVQNIKYQNSKDTRTDD